MIGSIRDYAGCWLVITWYGAWRHHKCKQAFAVNVSLSDALSYLSTSSRMPLPFHLLIISHSHLLIISSSHLLTSSSYHPLTFSPHHHLILSTSHLIIISSSHILTFSPHHHLIFSNFSPHHLITSHLTFLILTSSSSHLIIISSSHLLIISSSHRLTLSFSHLLTPHLLRVSPSPLSSHIHTFSSSHHSGVWPWANTCSMYGIIVQLSAGITVVVDHKVTPVVCMESLYS